MAASQWASRVTDRPGEFGAQVVLVTGGTRGIGRAIAAAFLEVGATVVSCGRLGEASDVAEACLFLASRRAAYISGAHLAVHGGGERPAYLDATEARD